MYCHQKSWIGLSDGNKSLGNDFMGGIINGFWSKSFMEGH